MSAPAIRVTIDPRSTAAYGVAGSMPVGAIIVLPGGVVVKVRPDGGLDDLKPGGYPRGGIAEDPTATRHGG